MVKAGGVVLNQDWLENIVLFTFFAPFRILIPGVNSDKDLST